MKPFPPGQNHGPHPRVPGENGPETRAPRFALVIPVFNHPDSVEGVLRGARLLGLPVFVVNDGSTDGTGEKIREMAGVTVLSHAVNRGKGAALLTGFTAAAASGASYAVTIDADGQHDPAQAVRLMAAVRPGERAMIVGCRQGMDDPAIPWTSRFGRKFSNFWVRVTGGPRVADSQSGFRLYPIPEVLQWQARARRFAFEVEILVLAARKGIPVREVPVSVDYRPGGKRISHFRPFVDFWRNTGIFTRLLLTRPVHVLSRYLKPG